MENHGDFFHEAKYTDQNGLLQTTKIPVVQELARKGITYLPERFISLPTDQQKFSATTHVSLPTIDLLKLRIESDSSRNEELAKLVGAAKEWGMFLITNHGVHASVLDGVKDVVKGFFGLSFEEKKSSVGSYMSVDNMGYGRNFVRSEYQPLDWIDRMTMVAFPADDGNLHVWPKKPHKFREVMVKYAEETRNIFNDLLQAMAEALSADKNVFLKIFEPKRSELKIRTNYYPPCPRPDLAVGLTPHSDASGLSLLIQFGAENGLQVLKDEKWMSPLWPADMLLVNLGDMMETISNGRLTSSWHRAITSTNCERFSVAVFYNPPPDAEIEPMQDENSSDGVYRKVNVRDYVEHYYKVSPTVGKEAMMYAKYDRRDLGGQAPAGGGPVIDVSKCPGAKGDGSSDMTQVIMKAWNDACHAPSPSRLLIPAGIWLAGELEFKGPCSAPHVTVEVQGTLKGKPDAAAYPQNYQVYFSGCSFQLMGSGTIDGNGAAAQAIKKASGGKNLPDTVVAIQCPNSGVSGLKIINSKGFHLKVVECDNFKVDSIGITSPETTLNTDGIHIARCKGACITNVNIATGDDCISIGDAMVDLTIRNIVCAPGHGISIGSLGKFPDEKDVRNVEVSNVTLVNTMYGLRIKTIHSGTALAVSNVTYSNIQCKGCGSPIIIDQHYNGGSLTRTPGDSKVRISGVTFKNMKGTTSANVVATLLCSTACGCEGINIQDVSLTYSGTDTEDKSLRTTCENAKATFTGSTIPACK